MLVVLDTNVLLVSIPTKSTYRPIFDALIKGTIKIAISNSILDEYIEIIESKTNSIIARNIGEFLINSKHVKQTIIHFEWSLIYIDQDDNKFVDCAIQANADYIISNDKHFQILAEVPFPKVNVLSSDDFLKLINSL